MGEMVERVAKAVREAQQAWWDSDEEPASSLEEVGARAAMQATADYIEERHGNLHPGVICIRSELTAGDSK